MKLNEENSIYAEFGDVFTARRAERAIIASLYEYFLVEQHRDYDVVRIESDEHDGLTVGVVFKSSSGRYAFWRFVHGQCPHFMSTLIGKWKHTDILLVDEVPPPESTPPEPKRAA